LDHFILELKFDYEPTVEKIISVFLLCCNLLLFLVTDKRIMVCLDGSKGSINAPRTAILFARQSGATIVGVHSDVSRDSRRSFSNPKIKKEKGLKEVKKKSCNLPKTNARLEGQSLKELS